MEQRTLGNRDLQLLVVGIRSGIFFARTGAFRERSGVQQPGMRALSRVAVPRDLPGTATLARFLEQALIPN
jgi:hypothetical protein